MSITSNKSQHAFGFGRPATYRIVIQVSWKRVGRRLGPEVGRNRGARHPVLAGHGGRRQRTGEHHRGPVLLHVPSRERLADLGPTHLVLQPQGRGWQQARVSRRDRCQQHRHCRDHTVEAQPPVLVLRRGSAAIRSPASAPLSGGGRRAPSLVGSRRYRRRNNGFDYCARIVDQMTSRLKRLNIHTNSIRQEESS